MDLLFGFAVVYAPNLKAHVVFEVATMSRSEPAWCSGGHTPSVVSRVPFMVPVIQKPSLS